MYSFKINSHVSFPLEDLDLKPFLAKESPSQITTYDLLSVICHHGTAGSKLLLCNIAKYSWSFEVLINGLVFVNCWRFSQMRKMLLFCLIYLSQVIFFSPLLNRWSLHSVLSECDQWTVVRV